MGGLTFQEQADIQRAMYASLHVGRHQLTKAVCSSDSQPTGYSQAVATVLTTTAACSTTTITSSVVHSSEQPPPAKKKRGRPRKYPKAETTVPNAGIPSLCYSAHVEYAYRSQIDLHTCTCIWDSILILDGWKQPFMSV